VFVAAQIALALVLITGAALLGRSLTRLLAVNPGFDPNGLLTFRVNLVPARDSAADSARAFHADVIRALTALPGVRGAATINQMPLMGPNNTGAFAVEGQSAAIQHHTLVRTVSRGYFDLLRLRHVQGRMFEDTDGPSSPRVVVVNKLLADTAFGGRPVGHRISFPFFDGQPWWDIVGVVGNEQFDSLDQAMRPVVYFPYSQTPSGAFGVLMRVDGDPAPLEPRIRQVVADVDPTTPVFAVLPLTQFIEQSTAVFRRKTALTIVTGFALSALALAAVGLYGAVALMVSRRTREIGLRQALGATRGQILGGMLRRGLWPVAIGLATGLGASLALAPSLASLMFGIPSSDPLTIAAAVIVLLLVTLVAALVPARQALRIDAVKALRSE
jgi:predicted permease